MYRAVIVPKGMNGYIDDEMAVVSAVPPTVKKNGRYTYTYDTLKEAKEAAANGARAYLNTGCVAYIIDMGIDAIIEVAHVPGVVTLKWQSVEE